MRPRGNVGWGSEVPLGPSQVSTEPGSAIQIHKLGISLSYQPNNPPRKLHLSSCLRPLALLAGDVLCARCPVLIAGVLELAVAHSELEYLYDQRSFSHALWHTCTYCILHAQTSIVFGTY